MSDYGFKTIDKNGTVAINSKWPIYGPKYVDIKKGFKTFHIIDNHTSQYHYGSISVPARPGYTDNSYSTQHGVERVLIMKREHGFDKKPFGQVRISGTLKTTVRGIIQQTVNVNSGYNVAPFTMPSYGNTASSGMYSEYYADQGFIDYTGSRGGSYRVTAPGDPSGAVDADLTITLPPYFRMEWFTGYNSVLDDINDYTPAESYQKYMYDMSPYEVDIDDKYIYVYRREHWADQYVRHAEIEINNGQVVYDVWQRQTFVESMHGSEFDVTVYFTPYATEDVFRANN